MPLVAFFRDHTPFVPDWNRICPAGAALSADVTAIQTSRSAAALLQQQVCDLVAAGQQLTLTMAGLERGHNSKAALQAVCELLGEALQDISAPRQKLGIAIDAACMQPHEAWQIRSDSLGVGPLYVSLPQGRLPQGFWQQLWELRSNKLLRPVYSPFVVSQTCLLPDENAVGVIPGLGLQVPIGSSWVAVEVNVSDFADDTGTLDPARLEQTLEGAVAQADEMHTRTRWPTAQMRHDAWLNRRLAICVTGIGTLLRRRDCDPGRFATLNEMNELLHRIRCVLFAATRELASRDGNLPALEQADPGRHVAGGKIGDGWTRLWRQALMTAAVRNRNLLAVSPWSIFPPGRAELCYANLLPLLRFADVCPFGPPPNMADWNLRNFRNFHQQAAAVLHQRGASHQIAVHA